MSEIVRRECGHLRGNNHLFEEIPMPSIISLRHETPSRPAKSQNGSNILVAIASAFTNSTYSAKADACPSLQIHTRRSLVFVLLTRPKQTAPPTLDIP